MYNLQFIWLPSTHSIINFTDPFYTFAWFATAGRGGRETVSPTTTVTGKCLAGVSPRPVCRQSSRWWGDGARFPLPFCPRLPPFLPIPVHEHLRGGRRSGAEPGSARSTLAAPCQSCPIPPGPRRSQDVLQVLDQNLSWATGKSQG